VTQGSWTGLSTHRSWLDSEATRLVDFGSAAEHPVAGFGWLDEEGRLVPERPIQAWITARMTHVYSLAHLRGTSGAGLLADHGVAALRGQFRDADNGGWYAELTPAGHPQTTAKRAYEHAFVVLAAASATAADRPGAAEILDEALSVVEERFWLESDGLCLESWDRDWTKAEEYRGANSNMHFVEAFLAAADISGQERWRERALSIAERLIDGAARENGWRLPEHFDTQWRPVLEYNADHREDPFRPYGTTVGHWLEWSRLLLHLEASLASPPPWLFEDARMLFDAAISAGWAVDGSEGFVYTLDWEDRPVVRARMHWVIAEAIAAAAALERRAGDGLYENWYRRWWDYAARFFIDRQRGSWHHELGPDNSPAASVWSGKPDVYHALQATLLPQLPLSPSLAAALRQRLLAGL
jgi:mannose/cellobiose epimerase-like protein (N-acyl-D-glucosamine 2-epimerase family)